MWTDARLGPPEVEAPAHEFIDPFGYVLHLPRNMGYYRQAEAYTAATKSRMDLAPFRIEPAALEPERITYRAVIQVERPPEYFRTMEMSFGKLFQYAKEFPNPARVARELQLDQTIAAITQPAGPNDGWNFLFDGHLLSRVRCGERIVQPAGRKERDELHSLGLKYSRESVGYAYHGAFLLFRYIRARHRVGARVNPWKVWQLSGTLLPLPVWEAVTST